MKDGERGEGKHTPTPWQVAYGLHDQETFHLITDIENLSPRIHVPRKEDANFIVRAVNAHDELLSQLKFALDIMRCAEAHLSKRLVSEEDRDRIIDHLKARAYYIQDAIAKAEGRF